MNELLRRLLDLPPQASSYARQVDTLHYVVIGTTMAGALFVFLLAIYFLAGRRRRTGGHRTERLETPRRTEIFIIASLQILFLAFWIVGAWQYDRMTTPPPDAMTVYVTAKQWMWKFSYPGGRSSLDVLTVPQGRPVKLIMMSRDVIHSFYVPAFRMKQDVVPGRYAVAWFSAVMTGDFPVECAEFCGTDHSRMGATVRVLSPGDYARWIDQPSPHDPSEPPSEVAGADMARTGREVAARRGCFSCHTLDGQTYVGPTWAHLYDSQVHLEDGRTVRADEAYLTRSMMDPQADIVAGYRPVMPTYRGVLAEPEVAALVDFIESLRDEGQPQPSVVLPRVAPEAASSAPEEPRR